MRSMANTATAYRPKRRFYSPALQCQVTQECRQSDASLVGVALRHGINANTEHRWPREPASGAFVLASQVDWFVAVALDDPAPRLAPQQPPDIA